MSEAEIKFWCHHLKLGMKSVEIDSCSRRPSMRAKHCKNVECMLSLGGKISDWQCEN